MYILIEIECDTIGEIQAHLICLIHQVTKEAKKQKLSVSNGVFPVEMQLSDSNSYGDHELIVVSESKEESKFQP